MKISIKRAQNDACIGFAKREKFGTMFKKTMRFLSMTALALVGAVMTGCSSEDNSIDTPQQPENKSNVVTLTMTVGFEGGATTRALSSVGEKTFGEHDQIAVIYKNTNYETVKAVSEEITDGVGTSSATFTVTLTDPKRDAAIRYIYPAAMAKETVATGAAINDAGTVDFTKLNTQDGTLATLGSALDLCTFDADSWGGDNLPNGNMTNQLAILALTLKNGSGPEINSKITDMTLSDGTNTYTVTRSASAGPIYVAIRPTSSANIDVTATNGSIYCTKSLSSKTYEQNYGYGITWKMEVSGLFSVGSNKKVCFSRGNLQYQASTNTWRFAENQWDYVGDATNGNVYAGETKCNNASISSSYAGWIDLFGWGTSGHAFSSGYGIAYQPWSTSMTNTDYGPTGNHSLNGTYAQGDWGTNMGNGWRTLYKDEWSFVFSNTARDIRFAKAKVNGVEGVILLPDSWDTSNYPLNSPNNHTANFNNNDITLGDWTDKLEANGAVFLPVAGYRKGVEVKNVTQNGGDNEGCYYWSSSCAMNTSEAYTIYIKRGGLSTEAADGRQYGLSVRLVRDVQ